MGQNEDVRITKLLGLQIG